MKFALATLFLAAVSWAQAPAAPAQPGRGGRGPQGPVVVSPEVTADKKVIFRILAPNAQAVKVMGGDIPGNRSGTPMTKGENGVWEVTLAPPPGAYRYNFNVDGMTTIDPRNPPSANPTRMSGAWCMCPARSGWTRIVCRTARWPR